VIGAIMVHRGEADALICGTIGDYHEHLAWCRRSSAIATACIPPGR
jgi:phosphotransacetylase